MAKVAEKGSMPSQKKGIMIQIFLFLLWLVILCGVILIDRIGQKADAEREKQAESAQKRQKYEEEYAREHPVITNEYQIKVQDAINTYEIKDGKLYGSGENTCGQLGTGEIDSREGKYVQPLLIAEDVVHVDACSGTLVYLNDQGELYGVGGNGNGQLGRPLEESEKGWGWEYDRYCITEPVLIMDHVKYAAVGGGLFLMVLLEDGKLYTLGDNLNGQLGNGTARPVRDERYAKEGTVYSSEPVHVLDDIAYIAATGFTAAAISKKGDLWIWGDNSYGEIGNSRRGNGMPTASTDVVSEPYLVLKKMKEVWFEDDHTVHAITFRDEEYVWGGEASATPTLVKY